MKCLYQILGNTTNGKSRLLSLEIHLKLSPVLTPDQALHASKLKYRLGSEPRFLMPVGPKTAETDTKECKSS